MAKQVRQHVTHARMGLLQPLMKVALAPFVRRVSTVTSQVNHSAAHAPRERTVTIRVRRLAAHVHRDSMGTRLGWQNAALVP